jgi:hypothetical protein
MSDVVVLRSLVLPKELDEALKIIAFHEKSSIHEVREKLIRQGLETYRNALEEWAPGLLPKTVQPVNQKQYTLHEFVVQATQDLFDYEKDWSGDQANDWHRDTHSFWEWYGSQGRYFSWEER